jgi:hypothetical protein
MPKELENIFGNSGTVATCKCQGFLFHVFCLAAELYLASLSVIYFFTIVKGFSEQNLKRRVEPWIHLCCLGFPFVTAVISLCLNLFHPAGFWCWIGADPYACPEGQGGDECRKSELEKVSAFRLAFQYVPLWTSLIMATCCMYGIYRYVRETESKSRGSTFAESDKSKCRKVAAQSFWYLGVFFLAVTPLSIDRVIEFITGEPFFPMLALGGAMLPLLGFMTYCAFKRPRYLRVQQEYSNSSRCQRLTMAFSFRGPPSNHERPSSRRRSHETPLNTAGDTSAPPAEVIESV